MVSPFKDITPEEFRRVTEVTYLGIVYGTMAALKRMLPRNRGVIVQVVGGGASPQLTWTRDHLGHHATPGARRVSRSAGVRTG